MMKHLYRSLTEISILYAKARELKAFIWQHIINNPVMPQEQENDDEDDIEDDEETKEEDEKEEKRLTVNESAQMDNLNQDDKRKQLVMSELAKLDNKLGNVRSINEDMETMNSNIDMQPNIDLEDRMKYLRNFMRIYLKSIAT